MDGMTSQRKTKLPPTARKLAKMANTLEIEARRLRALIPVVKVHEDAFEREAPPRRVGLREQVTAKIIEQGRPMTVHELQSEHLTGHVQDSLNKALREAASRNLISVYRGKGRRPSFYAPPGHKWKDTSGP